MSHSSNNDSLSGFFDKRCKIKRLCGNEWNWDLNLSSLHYKYKISVRTIEQKQINIVHFSFSFPYSYNHLPYGYDTIIASGIKTANTSVHSD